MKELYYLEKLRKNTSSLKDYYYLTKDKVYDKVKIYKDYETIIKNIYVDIYCNCRYDSIEDSSVYLNSFIVRNTNLELEHYANFKSKMSGTTIENIYNSIVEEINYHTCKKCRRKSETPICEQCKSEIFHKLKMKAGDKLKDQIKDAIKDTTYEELENFAKENEIGWLQKTTEVARFNVFKFVGEKTVSTAKTITLSKALAIAGASIIISGAAGAGIATVVNNKNVETVQNEVSTKNGIQLQKYATITFEGYDGYAYPVIEFDKENLEADILYMNSNKKDDFPQLVDAFVNSLIIEPVNMSNLSNEDNFIATIKYDKELYKELDIGKLDFQIEIPIKNLKTPEVINIFDYIEVDCKGLTGNGQITISYTDPNKDFDEVKLTVSKLSGLQNGETITITAEIDNLTDFVNTYGFVLKNTSQTVTLNEFDYYISTIEEIDDASLESMKQHTSLVLTQNYSNANLSVDNTQYVKTLFGTSKNDKIKNSIFIIYGSTITDLNGKSSEVYSYVQYKNIIINDNNITVDYNNIYYPSSPLSTIGTLWSTVGVGGWKTVAYLQYDLIIQDISEIYPSWEISEIN